MAIYEGSHDPTCLVDLFGDDAHDHHDVRNGRHAHGGGPMIRIIDIIGFVCVYYVLSRMIFKIFEQERRPHHGDEEKTFQSEEDN